MSGQSIIGKAPALRYQMQIGFAGLEKYLNIPALPINTDDKTICELFFCLMDELDDITFSQSMRIIIDALMDTVMEYFHITEQQLEEFTASFIQRLPKYMQKALECGSAAA